MRERQRGSVGHDVRLHSSHPRPDDAAANQDPAITRHHMEIDVCARQQADTFDSNARVSHVDRLKVASRAKTDS